MHIKLAGDAGRSLRRSADGLWQLFSGEDSIRFLNQYERGFVTAAVAHADGATEALVHAIAQRDEERKSRGAEVRGLLDEAEGLRAQLRATGADLIAAQATIRTLGDRNEQLQGFYTARTAERDSARRELAKSNEGIATLKAQTFMMSRPYNANLNEFNFGRADGLRSALGYMVGECFPTLETPGSWIEEDRENEEYLKRAKSYGLAFGIVAAICLAGMVLVRVNNLA